MTRNLENRDKILNRIIELRLFENITKMSEVHRKLIQEGFQISQAQVENMCNNLMKEVLQSEKREILLDSFLDSFDIIKKKSTKIVGKLEKFMDEIEGDMDNPSRRTEWLAYAKEFKEWMIAGMRRLDEIENRITKVKETITIVSVEKRMEIIKRNEEDMFTMFDAVLTEKGELKFNKPRPEFIARYKQWKQKKENSEKKKEVEVEA